jgi:hypothetical protein
MAYLKAFADAIANKLWLYSHYLPHTKTNQKLPTLDTPEQSDFKE